MRNDEESDLEDPDEEGSLNSADVADMVMGGDSDENGIGESDDEPVPNRGRGARVSFSLQIIRMRLLFVLICYTFCMYVCMYIWIEFIEEWLCKDCKENSILWSRCR